MYIVFVFTIKMNTLYDILHQTWSKGLLIPCHEAEDNKSLTRILPEGKSAHTDDPEIHLNS